jgi:hypothetical protein
MIDMNQLIGKSFNSHFTILDGKTGDIEEIKDQKLLVKDFFLVQDEESDDNEELESDLNKK